MAMFERAEHINVYGSTFVANAGRPKGGLDKLDAVVAPNAILNAGGRADEVRCFPGTREEVITRLEEFMDDDSPGKKRMMWLSGPAGAGKSAILQTVAERRNEQGRKAVNFFFFREDSTRSHSKPLVATLVYQLRSFYPALNSSLSSCLEKDPLIFGASIEAQFKRLISGPIQMIQQSTPIQEQILIIIDGLDEINDKRNQDQILVALHTLAHADHSPFLILVSSRAEPYLVMSFNRLGGSVGSIFLNDDYRPQEDIRFFVVAKFTEIKKDHHLARTLSEVWPPDADIEAITKKSSGQFIYAAIVMRYIQFSSSSPALSLTAILETRPFTNHNPFSHLDAVYSGIFSKVDNIWAVKLILFARHCTRQRVSPMTHLKPMLKLAGYEDVDVQSLFADLAAIIGVVPDSSSDLLVFYHASLEDYLSDKIRSKIYYVNEEEIAAELSSMCLRNIDNSYSIELALEPLGWVQKPTPELSKSLLHASTKHLNGERQVRYLMALMRHIERLYWEYDKDQFKVLLQSWSRFVYLNKVDKLSWSKIEAKNPSASSHYKQYWMTEGPGQEELPTLADSVPAGRAQSDDLTTPSLFSPNAVIESSDRIWSVHQSEISSENTLTDPPKGLSLKRKFSEFYEDNDPSTIVLKYASPQARSSDRVGTWARSNAASKHDIARISSRIALDSHLPSNYADGVGSLQRIIAEQHQPHITGSSTGAYKKEEEGYGSRGYDDGAYKFSMIWVKLHYQDDIRGLTLTPDAPFSEFVDNLTAKIGKNFPDLIMKFKDEDGDKITLRDHSDYKLAIETARENSKGKAKAKLEIWCEDSAR